VNVDGPYKDYLC